MERKCLTIFYLNREAAEEEQEDHARLRRPYNQLWEDYKEKEVEKRSLRMKLSQVLKRVGNVGQGQRDVHQRRHITKGNWNNDKLWGIIAMQQDDDAVQEGILQSWSDFVVS